MLVVDGSRGEGGGQIIRTALSTACITGRSVSIQNIRGGRRVPGLRAQHVTAARILCKMCNGRLRGAAVGSRTMEFRPEAVQDSTIMVDVGTAGSIPLILQAVVPVAWATGRHLVLDITGGTDVRWAPTADYARLVMGAAYTQMGCQLSMDIRKRGYHPRGGGRIIATVEPSQMNPVRMQAEPAGPISIRCTYHKMDVDVETYNLTKDLEKAGHHVTVSSNAEKAETPGAAILAYRVGPGFATGTDSLYDGSFGHDLARLTKCASVDENLADMLVVPASVAGGKSVFEVGRLTTHLETALYVASTITGCRYGICKTRGRIQVRIRS